MKKQVFILSLALVLIAVAATSTLAYFTASDKADNVITMGKIAIKINETMLGKDDNGNETEVAYADPADVMPGTRVSKIVRIKNDGGADAWIRAKAELSYVDAADIEQKLGADKKADTSYILPQFNTEVNETGYWIEGGDGYYYYSVPVSMDTESAPLFSEVKMSLDMGNAYMNCKPQVRIIAEAVQSDNNPIPEGGSVTDIQGWPMPQAPAETTTTEPANTQAEVG
ncbi:MAG: SipW-dependent-type signal peptide-containing protein [Eubacteriales bacterium]